MSLHAYQFICVIFKFVSSCMGVVSFSLDLLMSELKHDLITVAGESIPDSIINTDNVVYIMYFYTEIAY